MHVVWAVLNAPIFSFQMSEFLEAINTESIWSLQTCALWTSVRFSRVFLYLVFAAYDPT